MYRLLACLMLAAFVTSAIQAAPPKKKVEIVMKWNGSVEDEKLPQPDFITTAKNLEAVWKAWKVNGDVPKVDFTKNIVVAVYSPGSILNLAETALDDEGDLTVVGFGTRDFRPGFRYVLGVVSREGVKTVNKKPLPKE